MGYSQSHLGLSLGKSVTLLDEVFGLKLSRAGALGHVMWAGELVDPVVRRLFELLKPEPVIHADETSWRINGKNVWVWCFCNPRLALFLVDEHRSGAVVQRVLGDSLPGVLVTDFYAADHGIDCITQKCLVHLLCGLHTLRDEATAAAKDDYLQPLRTLLQDAIALGKTRAANPADFEAARNQLDKRLGSLIYSRPKDHDCNRINKRLVKHRFDLRLFLKVAGVPHRQQPRRTRYLQRGRGPLPWRRQPHAARCHRLRQLKKHHPHLPQTRTQLPKLRPNFGQPRRKPPPPPVRHPRRNTRHQHLVITDKPPAPTSPRNFNPDQHARTTPGTTAACFTVTPERPNW